MPAIEIPVQSAPDVDELRSDVLRKARAVVRVYNGRCSNTDVERAVNQLAAAFREYDLVKYGPQVPTDGDW